jgi:hypothetical protein
MKNKKYNLTAIILYSVIIALALGLPNMAFATPVPDTGQTQSFTNTFGEDSDYTINPHSYTDLGNGIVLDNVTGLEWQQATAPGTYNWYQAIDYCAGLSLGGHNDWRLPTIKELSTLIDSSIPRPGPTINTTYFPDTIAFRYWSSTTFAAATDWAWQVYFDSGYVDRGGKTPPLHVRAVRGGQPSSYNIVDNGDGTVTDTVTGLIWQQTTAPGTYTWEQALVYCENLTLGGKSDWRLPNRNELQSIVDYSKSDVAGPFEYVQSYHWTSTADAGGSNFAWYVNFGFNDVGRVYGYGHGDMLVSYYIRAVRGIGLPTSTTTSVCDADCWKTLYEQSQAQLQQCQADLQACQNPTTTTTAQATNIELSVLDATPSNGQVILKWKTETETGNAGYNVWRADNFVKINNAVIPALGSSVDGADYNFVDQWVLNGKRYFYLLEDIDNNGISTFHGPVKAIPRWIYGINN